jgi:prepilin-type processing-associated H-X9-DG protein
MTHADQPFHAAPAAPPSAGMAVTSLVLSLVGLVLCPLTSLPGLIVGIVALVRANETPPRASGKGMAIAGIVVGGLGLLGALITIPLMIAILLPAMAVARDAAMDLKSMENVREMTQGMLVLASSHDDEFPGADEDWQQVLITGAGVTPGVFESPSTDGLGADYFFVPVGKSMFDGSTVLIYEDPALDPSATIIGFADGHVEKIDEPRASMLLNGLTLPDGTAWTPHLSDPSAAGGRP